MAIVGTSGSGKASVGVNSYLVFAFDIEQVINLFLFLFLPSVQAMAALVL